MARLSPEARASLARMKRDLLTEFPAELERAFAGVTLKNAEELTAAIKRDAPVQEGEGGGALRDSVRFELSENGQRATVTAGGTRDVPYGTFVEFGTRHALARPFFWVNVRLRVKAFQGRYVRALNAVLKRRQAAP